MTFDEVSKSKGIKLELSTFRDHWRKFFGGKMFYFKHPQTKTGYESALREWYLLKATIDSERPNAKTYIHHIEIFEGVLKYWDAFGVPSTEKQLRRQVIDFVGFLKAEIQKPVLVSSVPIIEFVIKNKQFDSEFVQNISIGTLQYSLPDKWIDRLERMNPANQEKKPQTVSYWLDLYLSRMNEKVGRTIVKDSAANRKYTLSHFKNYVDIQSHINTLGDDYLRKYHQNLDAAKIARKSKFQYFKSTKMFIRFCSREHECDLEPPSLLDSREFVFREPEGTGRKRMAKKLLLWKPEEFNTPLPEYFRCYLLLMLNCGFRHIDIDFLQHSDIEWKQGRIIIQRNKLNQIETVPVISYKLWPTTLESLKNQKSDDPKYVFGPVGDSIKTWWKRNREELGLKNKRLDYLRKTGATIVDEYELGLSDFYLGEALSRTSQIHYSFNDGDPNTKLDYAIQFLGSKFGQCEAPSKTLELTSEMLKVLKDNGLIS